VHVWLNYLMITTVAVHAAAALKHHFIDRDDILKRMLPQRSRVASADAPIVAEPSPVAPLPEEAARHE